TTLFRSKWAWRLKAWEIHRSAMIWLFLNATQIQPLRKAILFMYLSIVRYEKAPRFQSKCGMLYLDLLLLKIQPISADYFAVHRQTAVTDRLLPVQHVTILRHV